MLTEKQQEQADRARGEMSRLTNGSSAMHMHHGVAGTLGIRRNCEQRYMLAYRTLVRLGLEPQLRRKYR